MLQPLPRFAFVDLETTGGSAQANRIIDIAIIRITPDGVHEWSSLVNPERAVPRSVEASTGITRAALAKAPIFEELAGELADMLDGYVFVAHNARAPYAALRNAFARMNAPFEAQVLCTMRLSRRLFPKEKDHSADAIISRHGLAVGREPAGSETSGLRHRALNQARLSCQYWAKLQRVVSSSELENAVNALASPGARQQRARLETPSEAGNPPAPLPKRLAWPALSTELQAAVRTAQARFGTAPGPTAQAAGRQIGGRPTGGRQTGPCAWRLTRDLISGALTLTAPNDPGLGVQENLYGGFATRANARKWLLKLATVHELCHAHLGLEKHVSGLPCTGRQAGRCRGACVGEETAEAHFHRMSVALQPHQIEVWPFPEPVLIQHETELYVLHNWSYAGTVDDEGQVPELLQLHGPTTFDLSLYEALRAVAGPAAHPEAKGTLR